MPSSAAIRIQIETALSDRIPSALTPASKIIRPVALTGLANVDEILDGGIPLGAVTEIVGVECSGRTSLALSLIACMTQAAKVCAWIDVSNTLHPESAAEIGVDLTRLLWVRCGVLHSIGAQQSSNNGFELPEKYLVPTSAKKGLHGGGFGPHPRSEGKGLSNAVGNLLKPGTSPSRSAGSLTFHRRAELPSPVKYGQARCEPRPDQNAKRSLLTVSRKPWSRIEQALQVTDLLLQSGGFSVIVLDMGSIAPEHALRVPPATWFRYRAAAERTQASILLLTQHACAKSSAELVLRLRSIDALQQESTVLAGIEHLIEVSRRRFTQSPTNVVPLKKPLQRKNTASWPSRAPWAGRA